MIDSNDKTKYWLAESLIDLMNTHSINKITVKDIVDNCGLTRQTFYRYFKDKFDLVNWYFEKIADKSFKKMGNGLTLEEGLIKKFQYIRKEQNFFRQAFLIDDCNSLINYDFSCIYNFYLNVIKCNTHAAISKEIDFALRLYCHGAISMTIEWIKNDLSPTEEEMAKNLIDSMPKQLADIIIK